MYASDLSMFLFFVGRSLAIGRFLFQGPLTVSIKFMVSEILNWDRPEGLIPGRLKKKNSVRNLCLPVIF
jgi:hypothetical protein